MLYPPSRISTIYDSVQAAMLVYILVMIPVSWTLIARIACQLTAFLSTFSALLLNRVPSILNTTHDHACSGALHSKLRQRHPIRFSGWIFSWIFASSST